MTSVRTRQSAGTRKSATQIPEAVRREVTRRGEELVARKFVPLLESKTSIRKRDFNYAVAVFTEWRGRSFYLCTRYRTPEAHLTRCLFGAMLQRIWALPVPTG